MLKKEKVTETVSNEADRAFFQSHLEIDKYNLDDQVRKQPSLSEQVSDRYALAVSLRDLAEMRLKEIDAKIYLEVKSREKDNKLSVDHVKAIVAIDSRHLKATKRLINAEREVNEWKGTKESYTQRSVMFTVLGKLSASDYMESDSVRGTSVRINAQKAEDYKDAIKRKREERK